jgi:hypothetical protein
VAASTPPVKAPDLSLPVLPPAESLTPGATPAPTATIAAPSITPPTLNDIKFEAPPLPGESKSPRP